MNDEAQTFQLYIIMS